MSKIQRGVRLSILSILVNCILATVKIVAGVIGTSYALIADGIESSMDIFSSIVVWRGLRISIRPADDKHPYGHGKAESIAGLVVAGCSVIRQDVGQPRHDVDSIDDLILIFE